MGIISNQPKIFAKVYYLCDTLPKTQIQDVEDYSTQPLYTNL